MKTTIFKSAAISATMVLAVAASATPAMVNLVLTELNSTTMTYSWQGGAAQTATETSPDNWTFSFSTNGVISSLPSGSSLEYFVQWKEPDYASSGLVNLVEFQQYDNPDNGSTVIAISDNPVDPNRTYPTLDNGGIYTFPIDGGNTVSFTDDGDSSVPDGGSTLLMLGLAGIGMGFFARKLK